MTFESDNYRRGFVLEVRPSAHRDLSIVRVATANLSLAFEALGNRAILHAPRGEMAAGYFATGIIEDVEEDPRGPWIFFFLRDLHMFERPISTLIDGVSREGAPPAADGKVPFRFYANGLRSVSLTMLEDLLTAAGLKQGSTGFGESPQRLELAPAIDPVVAVKQSALEYEFSRRRHRARLRRRLLQDSGAVCCLSGTSFDLPEGKCLLEVSHFWPLYLNGPDTLRNVGLMMPNVHMIYENGLVTLRSDHSLWFAPDIPDGFKSEFNGRVHAEFSSDPRLIPDESNLAFHREEVFLLRLKRLGISEFSL